MVGVYKLSLIFSCVIFAYGAFLVVIDIIARIARWRRRRKADARIIALAKGAGVWDKEPIVLGGRALELKAWQEFNIKREPGEPDAHLRRRCMAKHDEIDAYMTALRYQNSNVVQFPPEILHGEDTADTQTKRGTQDE